MDEMKWKEKLTNESFALLADLDQLKQIETEEDNRPAEEKMNRQKDRGSKKIRYRAERCRYPLRSSKEGSPAII